MQITPFRLPVADLALNADIIGIKHWGQRCLPAIRGHNPFTHMCEGGAIS